MTFARTTLDVLAKDLRLEMRGKHAVNLLLPFVGATLVLLGLALGPGRTLLRPATPALIWVTLLFATLLSVRRAFEVEQEDGALEGLVLVPADKGAIYLGKVLASTIWLLLLAVAAGLMAAVLFDVPVVENPAVALGGLVLGILGLSAVGCFFAGLVVSARAREAILPLLVLPLVVPVALGAIGATSLGLAGDGGERLSWLLLLLAFDAVFLACGVLLFDKVLED
ncbi:MAG: heme exporter protein CcmB [Actinomycetota bacterium]